MPASRKRRAPPAAKHTNNSSTAAPASGTTAAAAAAATPTAAPSSTPVPNAVARPALPATSAAAAAAGAADDSDSDNRPSKRSKSHAGNQQISIPAPLATIFSANIDDSSVSQEPNAAAQPSNSLSPITVLHDAVLELNQKLDEQTQQQKRQRQLTRRLIENCFRARSASDARAAAAAQGHSSAEPASIVRGRLLERLDQYSEEIEGDNNCVKQWCEIITLMADSDSSNSMIRAVALAVSMMTGVWMSSRQLHMQQLNLMTVLTQWSGGANANEINEAFKRIEEPI